MTNSNALAATHEAPAEPARTKTALSLDDLRNGPPTISVGEAVGYLGVSRAFGYAMARDGSLPTIKCGNRRLRVPTMALLKMLGGAE
jgi:excisionase family DNA binding protein